MAVAFDASTAGYEGDFDGTITVSHTPTGTPRAIVAFVFSSGAGTHNASATATYGGTSMTRLQGVDKTSGTYVMGGTLFFLGSSVPTGTQNFVFSGTGFKRDHAVVVSFTADGDTEVIASTVGVNGDSVSTHTYTLSLGGDTGYVLSGHMINDGDVANIGPQGSWGSDVSAEADHGAAVSGVYSRDSQGSGDITAGASVTGTYEAVGISVAIMETNAGITITPPSGPWYDGSGKQIR